MSAAEQSLLSVMGPGGPPCHEPATEADELAAGNWRANRAALADSTGSPRADSTGSPRAASQADVLAEIESAGPIGLTWIFGRDGALTAQDESGRWWGKCSVPRATAKALLRTFVAKGTVQCYLDPLHAAEIAAALATIQSNQAVIAIVPDAWRLGLMLRCEDFSAAIKNGRLWFVTGLNWARQLEGLLESLPGLPLPNQFIKTVFANEQGIGSLIEAAQGVFSRQTQKRAAMMDELRIESTAGNGQTRSREILVVAPSRFGLWGLAGMAMRRALIDQTGSAGANNADWSWRSLDPDQAASASPLALAMAAARCGAMVTADTGRSDAPPVVPAGCAWLTWITGPRVPAFDRKEPQDAIVLADGAWMDLALRAGWPKGRIAIAGWPGLCDAALGDRLGLMADIPDLAAPEAETNLSSQRLLWEFIRDELMRDPLACEGDPAVYLSARMRKFAVGEESLNRGRFIEGLIVPAYAIGLARALIDHGLPIKVWGTGWENWPQFADRCGGAIRGMSDLASAAGQCAALVHAWPTTWAHPIDALGRPVVRRRGRGIDGLVRAARGAMSVSGAGSGSGATATLTRDCMIRWLPAVAG